MDDVKKTNYRIDTLNQKMGQNSDAQQKLINQKIDAINRNMEERLMNQGRLAEIDTLSQLVGNQNQEHIQLKKEVGNQRQQIQTLVDTVHQLKEALEEERRTSMKQEVRLDHLSAVIDVDHVTLFDLAGDIAQVKMGGTSELSRVNNKIATKAGKREVERQLRALRVEGTHISAQKKPRHDIGSTSPIASFSPTQYRREDPLKAPAPPRRRMPLKKKVGYDFPMTNERSGGRFLDY